MTVQQFGNVTVTINDERFPPLIAHFTDAVVDVTPDKELRLRNRDNQVVGFFNAGSWSHFTAAGSAQQ